MLLLSIRPCWREIRPEADKTTENEFVARSGFGHNTFAADEQSRMFGSFDFNKHCVLIIFMIKTGKATKASFKTPKNSIASKEINYVKKALAERLQG